jgi:hypothetical protein
MPINWFEGGRRITWLLMAIPAMIGGYNAYDHSPARVEFFTASPRDGWHFDDNPFSKFSPNRCAKTEYLTEFQIKDGLVRNISLCFKPNEQGKIVYFSPKEETERLKKLEVASARAKEPDAARNAAQAMRQAGYTEAQIADGLGKSADFDVAGARRAGYADADIIAKLSANGRMSHARALSEEASRVRAVLESTGPNELSGDEYDAEVNNYVNRSVSEFVIYPDMLLSIEKSLPQIEREALVEHVKTTLLFTSYWIGGIWIFSFVLGWIVRGFAGVPRGKDFKPDTKK